jgi:hypothetical protein
LELAERKTILTPELRAEFREMLERCKRWVRLQDEVVREYHDRRIPEGLYHVPVKDLTIYRQDPSHNPPSYTEETVTRMILTDDGAKRLNEIRLDSAEGKKEGGAV